MKKNTILAIAAIVFLLGLWKTTSTGNNSHKIDERLLNIPAYIDDAHRHRWMMRGGLYDQSKILEGRRIAKAKLKKQKKYKDAGITSWTNLGPGNIGGRVRAIATYSPRFGDDVIVMGGVAGGIWKSTDGGQNWTSTSDFSPSLAVTSIVFHPSNTSILYASTGEGQAFRTIGLPGAGIFQSTDGGDTWAQLPSTNNSNFLWVNKIAINPNNGNHLLAVTANVNKNGSNFPFQQFSGEGKLYESLDGGSSWTEVLTNPFGVLTDVEFHSSNDDVRIVSGRGNLFVYNPTTDTYESKRSDLNNYIGRMEATICGGNANVMFALISTETVAPDGTNFAAIYQSTNGGDSWTYKNAYQEVFRSNTLGSYANDIWVDPTDCDDIYFGGVDLWKSTDGGNSVTKISDWTQYIAYINNDIDENIQLHADHHIIVPAGDYSALNRKVYIGNDGGIQKADNIRDGSVNLLSGWDNLLGSGIEITQYYGISSSPLVNKYGGGAQDAGFQIRQSAQWRQPNSGDGQDVIFHPTDEDIVYANVNYNKLYKSEDGGDSFTNVATLGEAFASLIAPMAMDMTNPNHVYLCGYALWRYNDIGETLLPVKSNLPDIGNFKQEITAISICPSSGAIWVGYNSGVIEYSLDAGATWSGDISGFSIPNTTITDIEIISGTSGLQAYITIGGYRLQNIWKLDASQLPASSIDLSMDFEMQVNSITHHPENTEWIYVGTDVGLFASEDGGQNWSVTPLYDENTGPEFENEGPVFTEVSDLEWDYESFAGSYNLVVGTFGRGLWLSSNILTDIFVDKDFSPGTSTFGTRAKPYRPFTQAIEKAENKGSSVIFLKGGVYDNINQPTLFDKRTIIKSEANTSAIIQ